MNRRISTATLIVAGAFFLLPQITLAAWWNPVSWFSKHNETAEVPNQTSTSTTQSQTQEKEQEKVVEKTIVVDNPDLQKQINELIQENTTLKDRVASLTSELNACKLPTTITTTDKSDDAYSDFEFKSQFENNVITLLHSTSRELKIKKAVFELSQNYSDSFLNDLDKSDTVMEIQVGKEFYNLEKKDDLTFIYLGNGIPISGNETITIIVKTAGGVLFKLKPDWSEWEIWDYTVGKPVRIE